MTTPSIAHSQDDEEITRYGLMSCFPGNDLISRFLRHYGEWSYFESLLLRDLSPTRLFDIGAYIGTFSLAMAQATSSFILAVDANPAAYNKLRKNLARNLRVPFATINAAISLRTDQVIGGFTQTDNYGTFSISPGSSARVPTAVSTRTLKSLREEFGEYDLLKLDVEGAEVDVILSDHHWITAHKPAIWAECNESPDSLPLMTLLLQSGYAVHYYRYPAFNPVNFKSKSDRLLPVAFEAGLLALPKGVEIHCPVHAFTAGASLFRVNTAEELLHALWLTPRWGKAEWEFHTHTELLALLARQTEQSNFEQFLVGEVQPASTTDHNTQETPLTMQDLPHLPDDLSTPIRSLAHAFGDAFGCGRCTPSSYQIDSAQSLRCTGCGRLLQLCGPILIDSQNVAVENALENLDYDALHGVSAAASRHFGNRWLQHIREKIPQPQALEILELGAGTGLLSLGMVLSGDFKRLIVSDLSEKFLRGNQQTIQNELQALPAAERDTLLSRLCFLNCTMDDLPLRSESVNVVVANSVLHHIYDYEGALRKIFHVLRPGGIAFFSEPIIEGKAFVGFMASLLKELDERASQPAFTAAERDSLGDLATLCTQGFWKSVALQRKDTADDKHLFSVAQIRESAQGMGWTSVEAISYDPINDGLLYILEDSLRMMQIRTEPLQTYVHVFKAFQRQVINEIPDQVCTPHAFLIFRK